MRYELLFKPFNHPKITLKNRIVMAPMTRNFSPDGVPGDDVAQYYLKRVQGGTGLIVSEGTLIDHPSATDSTNQPLFHGEGLKGWKNVIDTVHKAGGKMVPQIWHIGSVRRPGTGPFPDAPTASPSGLVAPLKKVFEPLTEDQVQELVKAYGQAAFEAKTLGFDGVEIHGAHGYLIDQFFWEGTNQRDDKYGGSLVARTRFAVEIVQEIRSLCGEEFPIILRWSQWKMHDYNAKLASDPDQLAQFLMPLSEAGVDIFHCSQHRFWEPEFESSDLNLAGWTKKITGKPTISVGSVSLDREFVTAFLGEGAEVASIDALLERLERQEFDLIAVGRAMLANPDWANKVRNEQFSLLQPFTQEHKNELR